MMKHSLFLKTSLCLLIVMSAGIFSQEAEAPVTFIAEEWPPFTYAENGEIKGLSYEIVLNLAKELKVNYNVIILPGVRGKKILDTKERTVFFSMFRTPERENKYKWVGPLSEESFFFYKRTGSPLSINSLSDAKKVSKIACRNTGLVYDYLKAAGFTNLDPTPNADGIYRKVVMGRCDLAIGETPMGVAFWLSKYGISPDELEKTNVSILKNRLYIAFSHDFPDTEIARWQHSLDTMKSSGSFNDILKKYLK